MTDLLRRYAAALSLQNTVLDLDVTTKRFVLNKQVGPDHPQRAQFRAILDAHMARVGGLSSPAEADATASKIIGRR